MSAPYKVLALDVDGTLVDGQNEMAPEVYDAVIRAQEAGAHIVIATGRSMPGVYDVLAKLGQKTGLAVSSNGAVVFSFDGADYDLLQVVTFDARDVVRQLTRKMPDALVAVEEIGVGYRTNQSFPGDTVSGSVVVQSVDDLVAEPVTRVIIRSDDHTVEEFNGIVEGSGLVGTNYYIGYSAWLDLAPTGVSKASGMQFVVDELGLSAADVLAIGDGNNDLELLAWAGRGVAMGQAPQRLKDVADAVTGSIDEHGAAREIDRWFT